MTNDPSNSTIRGYEILDELGRGGYGAVFKAHQSLLKRDVAIKIILPKYANEPEFIQSFEAEAELVARLEHPFIIPLYDFWRDPQGAYLVMRLVQGGSLRSKMEDHTFSTQETANIIDQVAAALHVAHRENVVHRDVKPDNILIDTDLNAYLSDFGIAKAIGGQPDPDTEEGLTGSIHYMPPEQIQGLGITHKADIYALGIVLYELLAGEHPYQTKTMSEIVMLHLTEPLPHLADSNPEHADFDMIIQRATHKDPEERYESTIALAKEFRSQLSGGTLSLDFDAYDYDIEDVYIANPYRGLQAFQEMDSDKFFGRDGLVQQLLARLQDNNPLNRFLAVVGPSGSGKSSVVKAGLIPAIRDGKISDESDWFVTETVPGAAPFKLLTDSLLSIAVNNVSNLEQKLAQENGFQEVVEQILPDDNSQLVLIIDQFEELFTNTTDDAIRTRYLDNLVQCITDTDSRVRVIITLRADFYDKPLQYRQFAEILRQRVETVLPLSPDEQKQVITQPAEQEGVYFESGLVELILSDIGEQPGTLPLLQYALTELFERRDMFTLTVATYRDIGGVTGALARRADELYEALDSEGQEACRQLFLRLVNVSEGSNTTRRRILRSELPENPQMDHVIDTFGKSRLLTFDRDAQTREGTIEVAHEAIIRNWDVLQTWIADNQELLQIQRRLTAGTNEWEAFDHDPSYLASGVRLVQFESLIDMGAVLNNREQNFLHESINHREQERRREEARKEHELHLQKQAANRAKYVAVATVIGLVVAVALSIFAFGERNKAEEQAEIADRRADEARSIALAANAEQWDERNQELAIALAVEANSIENPPVYAQNILDQLSYQPGATHTLTDHTQRVVVVAFSPDGTKAVTGSDDTTARLWDVNSGELLHTFSEHTSGVWTLAFSPDGHTLATGSGDSLIHIWDVNSGDLINTLAGHSGGIRDLKFTSDSSRILSASADTTARLWDVSTGATVQKFEGHTDQIFRVDISPIDDVIVTASFDATARLWDMVSGETLQVFEGHTEQLRAVAFSPGGSRIATASADYTAKIWDMESGVDLHTLSGHTNWVMNLAFSPDEANIVTVSADTTARLWDTASGNLIHIFDGHADRIETLAFSPAGDTILTGSWDTTARLWAVGSGELIHSFEGHTDTVKSVAFNPTGDFIMTGSLDTNARLWNVNSDDLLETFIGHDDAVLSVMFHPANDQLVSSSIDLSARIWDIESRKVTSMYEGHDNWVRTVVINSDGTKLVTGSDDMTAFIWDVESGEILHPLEGHQGWIMSATFSPDDSKILTGTFDTASIDQFARLWDSETGELIRTYEGHEGGVLSVAFSPDGTRILTGAEDDRAILWDIESGEILQTFDGHVDDVHAVAFSQDGEMIATVSADVTAKLWNANTGNLIDSLSGHTGDIRTVTFSPDDRWLLTGSEDTTAKLWDIETGNLIHTYTGHSGEVTDVDFNADGSQIVTGSWDRTIRLWTTDLPHDLVLWTYDNWIVAEVPCDQRELYGIEPACNEEGIAPTRTPYPDMTISSND